MMKVGFDGVFFRAEYMKMKRGCQEDLIENIVTFQFITYLKYLFVIAALETGSPVVNSSLSFSINANFPSFVTETALF